MGYDWHRRWLNNLGLVAINTVLLRWLFPVAAVGVAVLAQQRGWGLLNWLSWSPVLEGLLSVVLLDCLIYWQHRFFHEIPLLWRLHRVHHADPDYDLTTGSRFHPVEIIISMVIKMAAVLVLGVAPVAVILFEVILNGCAMFNHGNIQLPDHVDRWVRRFLVTPDMHRVHHSVIRAETDSNYGFNLPWWDHLFGSYTAQPREGHTGMQIGITPYPDDRQAINLGGMLWMPFTRVRQKHGDRRT
jgi:sterol desaturase/sphingolipid hydroxylase (fatty acid hydroxylase superfamily)